MGPPFGNIELTNLDGSTFWVRIADIERMTLCGSELNHTRLSMENGFCSSTKTVEESPPEIRGLISEHDDRFAPYVMDFLRRNS